MNMKKKTYLMLTLWLALLINGLMTENLILANQPTFKLNMISTIDTEGQIMDIVVQNDIAFIADDFNGFYIYNVSDKSDPVELYHDSAAVHANAIYVADDLAFLGILFEGIKIYNITDLKSPVCIGNYVDPGAITDIKVRDNIAFLSDHGSAQSGTGGTILVNVTDPKNPILIRKYTGGGKPSNLIVQNMTIISADYSHGYEILNISDPTIPQLISTQGTEPGYFGVYVENDYAYFTNNNIEKGLFVYNIKNLSQPELVSNFSMEGNPCDLQVKDQVAFIANGEIGLQVINVSDPNSLVSIGEFSNGGQAFDVEVCDNIIYVVDMEDGVEIVEISTKIQTPSRISPILIIMSSVVGVLAISGIILWKLKKK